MKLKNLFTNLSYKIFALIIGYSLWSYKSADQKITKWLTVHVCFYNHQQAHLQAPELIAVQFEAPRSSLYTLDQEQLALNIDCESLADGSNIVTNYEPYLFVPTDIKVVQWSPSTIEIIKHKLNNDE